MKIICIARNYIDHAKELNNPVPKEPVVFLKPSTAILREESFYIPNFSQNMQYECELVIRIGKNGKFIEPEFAHRYINSMTVGIDFTARDVQTKLKEKGLPWEIAKAFDNSAVVGKWKDTNPTESFDNIRFHMTKNDATVQSGNTSDMIFNIARQISFASQYFTLNQGDLLFTGTPNGVGKVEKGDMLKGFLREEELFEIHIK